MSLRPVNENDLIKGIGRVLGEDRKVYLPGRYLGRQLRIWTQPSGGLTQVVHPSNYVVGHLNADFGDVQAVTIITFTERAQLVGRPVILQLTLVMATAPDLEAAMNRGLEAFESPDVLKER